MSSETITANMDNKNLEVITSYQLVPRALITAELDGDDADTILTDMQEIAHLYKTYEKGAAFSVDTSGDSVPADLNYKQVKSLIDKEARFLFSNPPTLDVTVTPSADTMDANKLAKDQSTTILSVLTTILKKTKFNAKLLQGTKDCFIGKRLAIMLNFNETTGVSIDFIPALNFVYETASNDVSKITKIVGFTVTQNSRNLKNQRVYKKKYELEDDGFCYVTEEIYDGAGELLESVVEHQKTEFDYIPAVVILNDALTGDVLGNSEVEELRNYESWYSRLNNSDIDAERRGMNPIRWTKDMSPESTKGLSVAAGAFWDLATSEDVEGNTGDVGILESTMAYSTALQNTLNRIKNTMHEELDIPNVSPEALKGVVSSGKTLKAIYWGLIVRCNEKMLVWGDAIQFLCETIIDGLIKYPNILPLYFEDKLPDCDYEIDVVNNYSLPEDETEEKQNDLAEVAAQTMSKKAYMKKWRKLTDEEADAELRQIALERQILDDTFVPQEPQGQDEVEEQIDNPSKTEPDPTQTNPNPPDKTQTQPQK